jgi:hypothetical protein
MSIKPILNNPDALNNKSLNLWANSINVNEIGGVMTSGVYNPVITSNATLIPTPEANNAFFTKIGNILTITGKISVDEWNGGTTKNFDISLPAGLSVSLVGVEGISGVLNGSSAAGAISGITNIMTNPTTYELIVSQIGGAFPAGNNAGVLKYVCSFIVD